MPGRMQPILFGAFLVSLLTRLADAKAAEFGAELRGCEAIAPPQARLECLDKAAARYLRRLDPPKWLGRHHFQTEGFTIHVPTTLRYRSEGVIFVLYLKDASENIVENLHIGGVGEGEYRIAKPGTYSLDINGAEEWQIWLFPE